MADQLVLSLAPKHDEGDRIAVHTSLFINEHDGVGEVPKRILNFSAPSAMACSASLRSVVSVRKTSVAVCAFPFYQVCTCLDPPDSAIGADNTEKEGPGRIFAPEPTPVLIDHRVAVRRVDESADGQVCGLVFRRAEKSPRRGVVRKTVTPSHKDDDRLAGLFEEITVFLLGRSRLIIAPSQSCGRSGRPVRESLSPRDGGQVPQAVFG